VLVSCWNHGLSRQCGDGLGAPASGATLQDVSVMQKAVEHGADGSHVAKQFAPVFDWTIGRQQRAKTLVAAHDDFEQILGAFQNRR
jgi:hypothetical protein